MVYIYDNVAVKCKIQRNVGNGESSVTFQCEVVNGTSGLKPHYQYPVLLEPNTPLVRTIYQVQVPSFYPFLKGICSYILALNAISSMLICL